MVLTYKSCLAPTNLGNTNVTSSSAKLNWTVSECAANFRLQYRVALGTWQTITLPSSSASYDLTGLLPSTRYQWHIATVCQVSPQILSSYSSIKVFTTKAALSSVTWKTSNDVSDGNAESIDMHENNEVKIYPNPATNVLTLQLNASFKKAALVITDIRGKILWQKNNVIENKTSIPLYDFADGVYFILIKLDNENKMLKFVKSKL
jgi:hypothetical protein